ncbi:hypothetical protein CLAFUW4_11950 [Fulvia fulva]|uniref:Uncharacterized protein n=1 Tax=Passalora fulva TaxID=5499 RepID=A0A9Q8PDV6_PASFU|nr:uncharacterized protein CLAFUR5_10992 [Fulvia fulva]KAK4618051.1 hypothetical protein CLAFUR4_11955 [Fulvia fulva]KAK4618997.1 hypothetical protein CLAFUR0_11966 [Fulvia fulva]UJO20640.1 hypothetical protein CLAFUR5_10992 [Fulvia fulva]WPV18097.1 hypothetical protein CLAFUW4_11950 [Fulvia fulva]WPV32848.1 hypothetical protein CLAFUW7_11957 [Fulvia fulva]
MHHASDGATDIHISIIDTKYLAPENALMSTMTADRICDYIFPFRDEFFAFGTISGPAHHAIPCAAIKDRLPTFLLENEEDDIIYPVCAGWEECIEDAGAIAKLLPPRVQAAFAAHLLVMHDEKHPAGCERRNEEIVAFLSTFDDGIMTSLAVDDTIMQPGFAATHGYNEADRAAALLRGLVYNQLGQESVEALRRTAKAPDETPFEREQRWHREECKDEDSG